MTSSLFVVKYSEGRVWLLEMKGLTSEDWGPGPCIEVTFCSGLANG